MADRRSCRRAVCVLVLLALASCSQPPRPPVLVLHGAADDAVDNREWLGLDDLADREGFLAIYPDGTGPFADRIHMWNSGDCCGSAQWSRVDDGGFLLAVLD